MDAWLVSYGVIMSTITYTVICPFDKKHKFPVVVEVEDESEGAPDSLEEYCPFCDKFVRVTIDKKLVPDVDTLRRFGFDNN
jgi:hypothetical protein